MIEGIFICALLVIFVAAFWGWGKILSSGFDYGFKEKKTTGCGETTVLGFALFIAIGGLINYLFLFSTFSIIILLAPCLLGFMKLISTWHKMPGDSFLIINTSEKQPSLTTLVTILAWVIILLGLLVNIYLIPELNLKDDGPGYLNLPIKIIALGGIDQEPFSFRRLYTLGGHFILQAIVINLASLRYLSLVEPVLGILVSILLLLELARRNRIPILWILLSVTLLMASVIIFKPIANMNAVYLMIPPLIMLFDYGGRDNYFQEMSTRAMLWFYLRIGIVAGVAVSFRTSIVPLVFALVILILWRHWYWGLRRYHFKIIACQILGLSVGSAIVLLPLMLAMLRSSETLLYPFLGKGVLNSQAKPLVSLFYGVDFESYLYALAGVINSDRLLLLGIVICVLGLYYNHCNRIPIKWYVLSGSAVVFNYLLIIYGTSQYGFGKGLVSGSIRYAFPLIMGYILFLMMTTKAYQFFQLLLPLTHQSIPIIKPRLQHFSYKFSFLLGMLVITLTILVVINTSVLAWIQNKWDIREIALYPTDEEIDRYRKFQNLIPKDKNVLAAYLPRTYLLDFKRNKVFISDCIGCLGPSPGWPEDINGHTVAQYLRTVGIQYVLVRSQDLDVTVTESRSWPQYLNIEGEKATHIADFVRNSRSQIFLSFNTSLWQRNFIFSDDKIALFRVPAEL